jgi:uncharacterized iron-regulated membrane protein
MEVLSRQSSANHDFFELSHTTGSWAKMSRLHRIVRAVHGWVGALLTLYLFVISLSGTLLLWKQAYLWLAIPEARADFEPTPETLASIAADVEARFGDEDVLQIQFPTEALALTKVVMPEANYAYIASNGTIIDEWVLNERWEEWLYDLHHRFLLGDSGLRLTGSAGLVLLVLVLLGVIAFWPLRRGFGQGLWPRSTARPFLLEAHRNIGILVALPFLLSLVTGIVLAFPGWVEEQLEPMRRTPAYSDAMVIGLDTVSGAGTGDWLPALRRAQASFPSGTIRTATVPNGFNTYRVIGIQQDADWHPLGTSQIYIDAPEGYMDVRIDGTELPLAERTFNAAYPLHTGRLNLPYRLLMTASGLGLVLASIFGLLGFLGRFRNRS